MEKGGAFQNCLMCHVLFKGTFWSLEVHDCTFEATNRRVSTRKRPSFVKSFSTFSLTVYNPIPDSSLWTLCIKLLCQICHHSEIFTAKRTISMLSMTQGEMDADVCSQNHQTRRSPSALFVSLL